MQHGVNAYNSRTLIRPHSCSTCAFKERDGKLLRCHRNPPSVTPVVESVAGGFRVAAEVAVWPAVKEDQWCGEYRAFQRSAIIVNDEEALGTQ
jgi:hypothetical protein